MSRFFTKFGVPHEIYIPDRIFDGYGPNIPAIRELAGESAADSTVAVVSALIHLRRAVMSFSKAGFTRVYGLPAANVALDADMGRRQFVRYRFWQNLGWSVSVVRELLALASYKRRGLV